MAAMLMVVGFAPAKVAARPRPKSAQAPKKIGQRYLSRYAIDLTKLARQGKLQPVLGHHGEIGSILSTLSGDTTVNPLVIGELVSLDSAAIASGVAQNIVAGRVPDNLRDKRIFALNLRRLFRDAGSPSQSAARLQFVLAEVAATQGSAILFVADLHQLVGTYANPLVSEAMRQTLQLKQLRVIGVASSDSYAEYISADESLANLFAIIQVDEMGDCCETAANRSADSAPALTVEDCRAHCAVLLKDNRAATLPHTLR